MVRRDPHDVLGVAPGATQAAIKAAWRRLAREHHPDLAADAAERRTATRRMAEINAAYSELRSGERHHPTPGRSPGADARGGAPAGGPGAEFERPVGPPPPPPTRPVTARFDTTGVFHARNATTTPSGDGYRHRPRGARPPQARPGTPEPPRASDPTGPLQRLRSRRGRLRSLPTLDGARATLLTFGKFHGSTLGEVADREPSYVAWLARTITRDPDLLDAARVVAAALEGDHDVPGGATGAERTAGRPAPGAPLDPAM